MTNAELALEQGRSMRARDFVLFWLLGVGTLCSALAAPGALAASVATSMFWTEIEPANVVSRGPRSGVPDVGRTLRLNFSGLAATLGRAPQEREVAARDSGFELELPSANGGFSRFSIVETPLMEAPLAARYPMLKTYVGQGIDDPATTIRFDITHRGFRAQMIGAAQTSYIEPLQKDDTETYVVFNKSDYSPAREPMRCGVTGGEVKSVPNLLRINSVAALSSGANLRTYRLAVATTGEYSAALGGTVLDGLSGVLTTINRVNGIYERELSVRLVLVANNDQLIYTNPATDPYTNTNGSLMLSQNQLNINSIIGSANYDIGHVFSTGGGGIATMGSVCNTSTKARGVTGLSNPTGDSYDVDYVAHEMGHQFAGNHTFNGSGGNCAGPNRDAPSAYEPGSGVTIQAYAGICGADNLQRSSEAYFHRRSLDEMLGFTTDTGTGASCGVLSTTGNTPPLVSTGGAFTIPTLTPFTLTAIGSDADNDALTYVWEQFDLGASNAAGVLSDTGSGPLFRSFTPSADPKRTFPSLRYILNNSNAPPATAPLAGTVSPDYMVGEVLPSTARTMNFRVTVRDNRAGGGGINDASTAVTVVPTAGPFAVTSPNTAVVVAAGDSVPVVWTVASTDLPPINTANVEIALSLDGGDSFPIVLAANTTNDGSETLTIPANTLATSRARIRVAAVGNIYFDISDTDFTVTGNTSVPTLNVIASVSTTQGGPANSAVVATASDPQTAAGSLVSTVSQVPPELSVTVSNNNGDISMSATATCSLYAPKSGTRIYPVLLSVSNNAGGATTAPINIIVSGNSSPSLGSYGNIVLARGNSTTVTPSTAIADANDNIVSITVSPTSLPGSGAGTNLTIATDGTVSVNTDSTTSFGAHTIRVQATDSCGATRIREFSVQVPVTGALLQYASNLLPTGNGVIERGECNPLLVSLANLGNVAANAVRATLWSATPGVIVSQPATTLPDVDVGATQTTTQPFLISTADSFVCGADANFTLVADHGGGNSPSISSFSLPTGIRPTFFTEAFDGVTPPALPAAWVTAQSGSTPPPLWVTTTVGFDTAPNAAFTLGVDTVATNDLVTPAITLPVASSGATITVRHAWNFESGNTFGFDGGVLELSTDDGATFNDVVSPAVGGQFLSNGYNFAIDTRYASPIAGRNAWSAVQANYVSSIVQLPPALNGQNIRLRFRGAWDASVNNANANWRIDGVAVALSARTCLTAGSGACTAPALLNVDDSAAPDIYDSATDGALLMRYLLGFRDEALNGDIVATTPQRNAAQIASHIATHLARFDVDGDGAVLATSDVLMIVRRLLGLSGSALTAGARVGSRSDVEIANAIDALRP
jgi:Metallo-peptidase family M12B Reprolysin-like